MTMPSRKIVQSHVDGIGAVRDALAERQLDPWALSQEEWAQLTPKQREDVTLAHERESSTDADPGALSDALEFADATYAGLTRELRKSVLHPRHLRDWLKSRPLLRVIDTLGEPPSHMDALDSDSIVDTGPQPAFRGVYVTVAINAEATTAEIKQAIGALLDDLHPTELRRPKKSPKKLRKEGTTGLRRERRARLTDAQVAEAVRWYYELQSGAQRASIAKREAAKPTPEHIRQADRRIRDYVDWLERELRLPRHSLVGAGAAKRTRGVTGRKVRDLRLR